MFLKTYIPTAPLNKYIELFAYYRDYDPDYSAVRMLPEGTVEILIALDDIPRVFYKNVEAKETFTPQKAIISGMQQEYLYAQSDKGCSMFAVKFKAGGSYPFLHLPLVELNNLFVEAEQILGSIILSLREQLLAQDEPEVMFQLMETFLMSRFEQSVHKQGVIDFAVSTIQKRRQATGLKALADELGYSQKQFIQIFKTQVGLSPKYYQRVARFNNALRQINRQAKVDWSQISYVSGFYDQAHFINEFKFFSGLNPEHYLHRRGEYLNFIPLYPER